MIFDTKKAAMFRPQLRNGRFDNHCQIVMATTKVGGELRGASRSRALSRTQVGPWHAFASPILFPMGLSQNWGTPHMMSFLLVFLSIHSTRDYHRKGRASVRLLLPHRGLTKKLGQKRHHVLHNLRAFYNQISLSGHGHACPC